MNLPKSPGVFIVSGLGGRFVGSSHFLLIWWSVSRPSYASREICMGNEFRRWSAIGNLYEDRLESSLTCKLHSRNAVCVIGDKYYPFGKMLCGIGSYIEAYPHIDPFLLKLRVKICISGLHAWQCSRAFLI